MKSDLMKITISMGVVIIAAVWTISAGRSAFQEARLVHPEHISCFELKDAPACVAHDANGNFLWLKSPEGKKLTVVVEDE